MKYPTLKHTGYLAVFMPLNPQGCWDWWGYTGNDYATQDAEQIQAVKQIAQSLTQLDLQER